MYEIQLTQLDDNDSLFSRAFSLGYIKAKVESEESFTCLIPECVLEDALALIGRASQIQQTKWQSLYTARFINLKVVF